MKVSVIIPIYNQREDYFKEAIESVVNQTVKPHEIIVVDDGSDKPVGIVLSDARGINIRLHRSEKNRGIGWARGKGSELATGDYIAYCSSDDLLEPTYIEKMSKVAKENPDKILYSNYYIINKDSKLVDKTHYEPIEDHNDFCVACWENADRDTMFVNFGSVFIPKKVFDKIQFDTDDIRHSEDLDFLLRSMKFFEYYLIKEPLIRYRVSPTMTTQKVYKDISTMNIKIREKCKAFWEKKE